MNHAKIHGDLTRNAKLHRGVRYRQQVDQVLVGVQLGGDLLELDQLINVVVEGLELLDVHLVVLHIVRHGFIDRNQVFEVDAQDRDFKTRTPVVHLSVVVIVSAGGQQVCHLVQYLRRKWNLFVMINVRMFRLCYRPDLTAVGVVHLGDLTGYMRGGVLQSGDRAVTQPSDHRH